MISTYGGVLSAIEKVFQELVEKYWRAGKFLWDLVEGQEKNTAQLAKIGDMMEWRWCLERENKKEENRDNKGRSEDGPRESQEERTPLSVSCWNSGFILVFFNCYFIFCDLNVWVRKSRNKMKTNLKVSKRNPKKYIEAGG